MDKAVQALYHNFISSAALRITDFSLIDKEIIISKVDGTATLGNTKEKEPITTISDLRNILSQITASVCKKIDNENIFKIRFEFPFSSSAFLSQLVFDVLFDKYRRESPTITLNKYCEEHLSFEWDESFDSETVEGINRAKKAAAKMMAEQLKYEAKLKGHQILVAEAEKLGIPSNRHSDYLNNFKSLNKSYSTDKKKYKYEWDQIYYNGNHKLITSKQFRRGLQIGKHFSYDDFENSYKTYDRFVKKFMPGLADSNRIKFFKSMDFYNLEIYKRLDFIYKLAVKMKKNGLTDIDRNHPMVKRFHPEIQQLYINNDRLDDFPRIKYYRPFLLIEKTFFESNLNFEQYSELLIIYYILRAKTYELFNYKFNFFPMKNDTNEENHYADIWDFISKHYNILDYHTSQKEWFNNEAKKYSDQVMHIRNAVRINAALFWESDAKKAPSRKKRKSIE